MDLGELLDELRGGILRDSSSLKNGKPDRYWSDDTLIRYIDDAHKRFARLSLCIHDDVTPEICELTLVNGVLPDGITPIPQADIYDVHKSVLSVLSAKHQDDQQDLVRITHETGQSYSNPFTEMFDFSIVTPNGKPTSYSTDEGLDPTRNSGIRMRFFGVPNATQVGKVVRLRVIRLPIGKFTTAKMSARPEIPEEYHLDLLEWAAWRALRNWDIDSEDRSKADQHRKRFEDSVLECRKDVIRKRWQAARWVFGQNAYSGYVKN